MFATLQRSARPSLVRAQRLCVWSRVVQRMAWTGRIRGEFDDGFARCAKANMVRTDCGAVTTTAWGTMRGWIFELSSFVLSSDAADGTLTL